ncbi:MAG: hypothetical protein LBL06_00650 [Treponema sp.]|nr:hypothetical protein [Treponema sp.]
MTKRGFPKRFALSRLSVVWLD